MKKVPATKRSSAEPIRFHPLLSVTTFFLGVLALFVIQQVFAHGGNPSIIHSCVHKGDGNIRIIDANGSCKPEETPLDWNVQGPPGPQGPAGGNGGLPYACNGCNLVSFATQFKGNDFSRAQIQNSEFSGADLTGVNFKSAFLGYDGFNNTNLSNADFSNIKNFPSGNILGYVSGLQFTNANLTNANFSDSQFSNSNFTKSNLQNTNFSNTQFTHCDFTGAQNMSTANLTGAIWNNVICPDGTNSDSNGHTCVSHF